jgi:glycosyltransferase 2 family protein
MRGKLWLGVALSLVLLWLAFRGVDLDEVVKGFRHIRPMWLVPALLSIFVRFWVTAIRWRILLGPKHRVGIHRLFGVTLIGFMANNIFPARIGEFVRAYVLGRAESLAAPLAFATIVIERIFDGLTLLLFLGGGLFFLSLPPWLLGLAAASCCLYLVVLAILLSLRWEGGVRFVGRLLAWLPLRLRTPAHQLVDAFRLGLDALGNARALLMTAGLSLVIWAINALGLQATFAAFSLALPLQAGFLGIAIIAGILVLPSAPGYVGTFQLATKLALAPFGVPEATALSVSIVYHAINYVPITILGLVYLGALNLTLGEIRTASQETP